MPTATRKPAQRRRPAPAAANATRLVKDILLSQFQAALSMLKHAIDACPPEHWDTRIATATFRQIAYHTLFFTDVYLSPREEDFRLRPLHTKGGDERRPVLSDGLDKPDTIALLKLCRAKAARALAAETPASLRGPSGFSRRNCARAELHLYNIRHIQHHAAAMAARLRQLDPALAGRESLPWIGHGWHP